MKKDTSTYLLIAGGVVVVVLLMRSTTAAKAPSSNVSTLFNSITNIINGIGKAFGGSPSKPGSSITPGAFGSGATSIAGSQRSGSDFTFDDGSTLDGGPSAMDGTGDSLLAPTFDA